MVAELGLLILFLVLSIFISKKFFVKHHGDLPPSPLALPIIGHFHLLSPLIHRSFHDLSLRFGPIFSLRLGSVPCIVVTSPELAKEFLKTHELSFINRSETTAVEKMTYNASFAFAPYGNYWKFTRKLITNELLGGRNVDNFLAIRNQEYMRFLRHLTKKAETCESINLSEELPRLGHNVIGQMMLGKYSSASRAEEMRVVVREATEIFGEFNFSDFNWIWKKFNLQGFQKRTEVTHKKFDVLVEKVISEREELRKMQKKGNITEEKDVKGFLDILLDIVEGESSENLDVEFSRDHIKGVITDLFAASIDTTSIAMDWTLAELINHPEVLKKAREEIDRVVGKGRLVGELDVPNLPYIQAIIKEAIRLHPPLTVVARKCVEQCKVGKYVIDKETMLFINNWAIGRDPQNWEKPLEFCPERFLQLDGGGDKASAIDVRGQHFQYLPFGSGRRICPGITLTMKMLPALLAAMIQCFNLKVVGTHCKKMDDETKVLEMDEKPGFTTPRAYDLVCVPVARFGPLSILKNT
ncbi:PREDICTED: licodione synthase-like [Fragaria vesca subsp. vesca]|uniref:licodione synthase-like n=1 Tax=Fragaria vesca subsp. vesca TaxID=101020 RepID=UPI0002C33B00|nr:PREDICTED: licodione synthase-like [Fragaria vesca subsp. vesca]